MMKIFNQFPKSFSISGYKTKLVAQQLHRSETEYENKSWHILHE